MSQYDAIPDKLERFFVLSDIVKVVMADAGPGNWYGALGAYAAAAMMREMCKRHETVFWAHVTGDPELHAFSVYGDDVYLIYTDADSLEAVPQEKRGTFEVQETELAEVLEAFLQEGYCAGMLINPFLNQTREFIVRADVVRLAL